MNRTGIVLAAAILFGQPAAAAPGRPVQLSKVVINPDIPKTAQKVKVGTICLFAGSPLDFGAGERTVNFEKFERLFVTVLQQRGYNVVAKSSDMFESEGNGAKPDFLVGATFRPQSVDICDSVNGRKGTIAISVEWQIYDRAKRAVVETVTSAGTGQVTKFNASGLQEMIDQAFSAAVGALADQGALDRYLGKPGA